MFESMPITALVRNLGKMSQLELFGPFSEIEHEACVRLTNKYKVKKSRIHPIQVMNAYIVYKNGHSYQGSLTWEVSPKIVDALEKCFYLSFKNIEPSGKRIMLALDVSGSMTAQLNRSLMSCRVASAVLAMCTIKTEPFTEIIGFTSGGKDAVHINNVQAQSSRYLGCYSRAGDISRLPLSANAGLREVVRSISNLPFARTDCSLPFIYCENKGIDVDAVCIYTDNETYAGYIHPWQALDSLQQKLGHEVKCIVVGMTATGFSIARPEYRNMLDVVGFDTNTPSIISDFIKE
jgi:60 kDa SS-A/Ro ribonucleoprotein